MPKERNRNWKIIDLPWDSFDASKVDIDLLKIVKAAALVEYNAGDYATYLCNVFPDDGAFRWDMQEWAEEETQHGRALGMWAQRADPTFDFKSAFTRYATGYRINVGADSSIRGSKTGELVARCIVETGTSSYYTALADATEEPVLKSLCQHIAADELRHYKMFHTYLKRYLEQENLGRIARLRIGLGRVKESEDDELAFAYFAANMPLDAWYDRETYTSAYMARAYPLYRPDHIERMVAMVFRTCGFKLPGFSRKLIKGFAQRLMRAKAKAARRDDPLWACVASRSL